MPSPAPDMTPAILPPRQITARLLELTITTMAHRSTQDTKPLKTSAKEYTILPLATARRTDRLNPSWRVVFLEYTF